jgi:hypothetical protein
MLIVSNGMIRSGSTLQFNIVMEVLSVKGIDFTHLGFMEREMVDTNKHLLNCYIQDDKIYILKTHQYTFLNSSPSKILYSYRDIRDVAASAKKKFKYAGDVLIDELDKTLAEQKLINSSTNILIQPYENLTNSRLDSIGEIANFLKIELTQDDVENIFHRTSIDNLKFRGGNGLMWKGIRSVVSYCVSNIPIIKRLFTSKTKEKIKPYLYPHNKNTLLHENHISSSNGENGDWNRILDDYEKNTVQQKYKSWMKKYNYK